MLGISGRAAQTRIHMTLHDSWMSVAGHVTLHITRCYMVLLVQLPERLFCIHLTFLAVGVIQPSAPVVSKHDTFAASSVIDVLCRVSDGLELVTGLSSGQNAEDKIITDSEEFAVIEFHADGKYSTCSQRNKAADSAGFFVGEEVTIQWSKHEVYKGIVVFTNGNSVLMKFVAFVIYRLTSRKQS